MYVILSYMEKIKKNHYHADFRKAMATAIIVVLASSCHALLVPSRQEVDGTSGNDNNVVSISRSVEASPHLGVITFSTQAFEALYNLQRNKC